MKKNIIPYLIMLPPEIEVEVHRAEEGGFWAKVKNFPGCVTQAENFTELVEMINDAVFVYLGIPEKMRGELGYYAPNLSHMTKKIKFSRSRHEQIEKIVSGIIRNKKVFEFSKR